MVKETINLKRMSVIAALLTLLVIVGGYRTTGQEGATSRSRVAIEEWEYLAVAGPGPASLLVDPHKRKEPVMELQIC